MWYEYQECKLYKMYIVCILVRQCFEGYSMELAIREEQSFSEIVKPFSSSNAKR